MDSSVIAALTISIGTLVISVGTLIFTRTQSVATRRQATSAEQQLVASEQARREQLQPYVIVDLRPPSPSSFLLNLIITNVGPTLARDIEIRVDPPLQSSIGKDVAEKLEQVLARKISTLPPGQSYSWFVDSGPGFAGNSHLPRKYTFTVQASGPFGPMEPMEYLVDLAILLETDINTATIEGYLEKIVDKLDKLTSAVNQLSRTVAGRNKDEAAVEVDRNAGGCAKES